MKTHIEKSTSDTPVNLVAIVGDILMMHGHQRPDDWKRFLNPDALNTNDPLIQRFLINRAWRTIIGSVADVNTIDIRYCLVDNGEITDWIRLFETGVVPFIIQYNLPVVVN